MADHFAYIRPLLFLQKVFAFRILDTGERNKVLRVLRFFHFFLIIAFYFLIGRDSFNFFNKKMKTAGENYLSNVALMMNNNSYILTSLMFYCAYLRLKQFYIRTLYGLKGFDEVALKYFQVKLDHKNLRIVSLKFIFVPTALMIFITLRSVAFVKEFTFQLVVRLFTPFLCCFSTLQLTFHAFIYVSIYFRIKSLHLAILRSLRRERDSEFKVDVLLGLIDDLILIMKNLTRGITINYLMVLGK